MVLNHKDPHILSIRYQWNKLKQLVDAPSSHTSNRRRCEESPCSGVSWPEDSWEKTVHCSADRKGIVTSKGINYNGRYISRIKKEFLKKSLKTNLQLINGAPHWIHCIMNLWNFIPRFQDWDVPVVLPPRKNGWTQRDRIMAWNHAAGGSEMRQSRFKLWQVTWLYTMIIIVYVNVICIHMSFICIDMY